MLLNAPILLLQQLNLLLQFFRFLPFVLVRDDTVYAKDYVIPNHQQKHHDAHCGQLVANSKQPRFYCLFHLVQLNTQSFAAAASFFKSDSTRASE